MDQVKNFRERIADELEEAARLLRQGAPLESVAWRLADVAADFVTKVEKAGLHDVQGVHHFSGKGGKLSKRKG